MAEVITVTALNRYVRSMLEANPVLSDLALRGEIQNFVHHRSGHFYFSLKDENCSVKAVMFRSNAARLSFEPKNGMRVIVRCRVSLYDRDGAFQVYVEDLFPDGIGAAQMAFEQLKAKLQQEGLFSAEIKKPIPRFPRRIGLVTSKSGAAMHDILSVAQRRWPAAQFVLAHAGVQGREAEDELVQALQMLDRSGRADVIIIARGGGSREDLWVFNGEKLARAVYRCSTPVVSAVGHEIDYTILDFVADLRAATPTAAAEIVLPDRNALRARLEGMRENIRSQVSRRIDLCYTEYTALLCSPGMNSLQRRLEREEERLGLLMKKLDEQADAAVKRSDVRLKQAAALLESLSPYRIMARGYCAALQNGHSVREGLALCPGDQLQLVFRDAQAICTVDQISKERMSGEEKAEL